MLIISRSMDYSDLLDRLSGKKVAIWTCNTCARLCNSIGGTESSERLASKLREDGVEVTKVVSTSAACLGKKVAEKKDEVLSGNPDIILCMTCDAGAQNAGEFFGKEIINPIVTHGYGLLSDENIPILMDNGRKVPVSELSQRSSPFI